MTGSVCVTRPFYGSDDSVTPPLAIVELETSCDKPDLVCTDRRSFYNVYRCKNCGGGGTVDNGCGN